MNKNSSKITREEKLVNRIIINFGIAILAYIVLSVLFNKFYMKWQIVLPLAAIMLLAAVFCYIFDKKTGKTKNYGHMFIAFGIALLLTQSSFIIWKVFGADVFNSLYKINVIKMALNSRNAVIGISWLGAVYLVVMTIYNCIEISKERKKRKKR